MRRILLALLILVTGVAADHAHAGEPARLALLIGNQNYVDKVGPLKNPQNDVKLLSGTLSNLAFKVTTVFDGDYRTIDTAIKRHISAVRKAGPGAVSVIYYSGHGAADPETKINYLIPVDVISADDEDVWNSSLDLNTIVDNLRSQTSNATHYVIFDARRNELNLTHTGKRALGTKGFVPLSYGSGMLVAYATAPGQTATDLGESGGIYAKALANEIMKPGVDSVLVFARVARRVLGEIGQNPYLSQSTMPEIFLAGAEATPAAISAADFTGTWTSEQWGGLVLKADGALVRGDYYYKSDDGPRYGHMQGDLEGRRLNFRWWEGTFKDLAYQDADYGGDGYLVLSEMGKKLEGKWRNSDSLDWSGDWVAARTK